MKTRTIELTDVEARHILSLMERNREDGIHTRPERQYWVRATRIEAKLGDQELTEARPEQAVDGA